MYEGSSHNDGFRKSDVRSYLIFYEEIREVEVEIFENLDEENPIPEGVYRNLGKAAMEMAIVFTKSTLELFREDQKRSQLKSRNHETLNVTSWWLREKLLKKRTLWSESCLGSQRGTHTQA